MGLREYKRKRNFQRTPEPSDASTAIRGRRKSLRFVIQKHSATRLHYDFRLETRTGLLKSWAVPKGVSLDPRTKRLAIMTEDHPGDYAGFEGVIPEGNYGAGRVIVWDTGKYETARELDEQIKAGKVTFTLYGKKVTGRFSLVRLDKKDKQWLLVKSRDGHASPQINNQKIDQSVLSGKTIESLPDPRIKNAGPSTRLGTAKEFPSEIRPMLATPVDKPFDNDDWVFEIKWDGVRAILFLDKSANILRIQSRKGGEITKRYPEIAKVVDSEVICNNSAVLDGEIVILDKEGLPDFQRHQRRMNVDNQYEVSHLSRDSPATYYVFDVLYHDGMSLEDLDFTARREILSRIVHEKSRRIRISDFVERQGTALFQNAIDLKLEGIVAKYKYSKYIQGARSGAWLKIKGSMTQDCVVIGYTVGQGNRQGYFGSLILAVLRDGKLQFAGHSGSGFAYEQLEETLEMMRPLAVKNCPIDHVPYVNREPVWLRPELVVEVKFHGWTHDGIMRAPIFIRFREDKRPGECIVETPKKTPTVLGIKKKKKVAKMRALPEFSNLEKRFWNATSQHRALTKRDLIEYYDKIGEYLLPHLRSRPLSLSRYPDGIQGKSFYHKNWDKSTPKYAETIRVYSESSRRIINNLMCNNKETLLWLANLGCIEMHPWYSRVRDFSACSNLASGLESGAQRPLEESKCGLETPDYIIFDLDPYIYSGKERKGAEPEYNIKGFKAAVEVAHMLKNLLDQLSIECYVKTSGKTGLHVFIPLAPHYTYEQTRSFARLIGVMLVRKSPNKITMEWQTAKRKGKVFFDHNQNAKGKTVASIFSVRPTRAATVSMPIDWKDLDSVKPTDFTILDAPDIVKSSSHLWDGVLKKKQDLADILDNISELRTLA